MSCGTYALVNNIFKTKYLFLEEETEHDSVLLTLLTSSTAACPLCTLRQARITLAPLFARSMAVDFPMPVLLPGEEK